GAPCRERVEVFGLHAFDLDEALLHALRIKGPGRGRGRARAEPLLEKPRDEACPVLGRETNLRGRGALGRVLLQAQIAKPRFDADAGDSATILRRMEARENLEVQLPAIDQGGGEGGQTVRLGG